MSIMTAQDYTTAYASIKGNRQHVIHTTLAEPSREKRRVGYYMTHCGIKVSSMFWLFQSKEHASASVQSGTTTQPCRKCLKAIIKEDKEIEHGKA